MYDYRHLTPAQKAQVIRQREAAGFPLLRPPHLGEWNGVALISAATYEHKHYLQAEEDRRMLFEALATEFALTGVDCHAWVILPNHYHSIVRCERLDDIRAPIGRVHGRISHALNRRDGTPGRQVWCGFTDRAIRGERHYGASLNYVHYNPVRHGYARTPLEWACSSVHWYLEHEGIDWLSATWRSYPVGNYGKGWDW